MRFGMSKRNGPGSSLFRVEKAVFSLGVIEQPGPMFIVRSDVSVYGAYCTEKSVSSKLSGKPCPFERPTILLGEPISSHDSRIRPS